MDSKVLTIGGSVAGIGGLALGVYLLIYRSVIAQNLLFQTGLNSTQAFFVIVALMILTFGIAVIGMMAWIMTFNYKDAPIPLASLILLAFVFAIVMGSTVYVLSLAVSVSASAQVHGPSEDSGSKAQPKPSPKVIRVCFGNGGGNNCLGAAEAKFDCATYRSWGAGGKMIENLGSNFCSTTVDGAKKQLPFTTSVFQNNGGGECGWTGFVVTCNP